MTEDMAMVMSNLSSIIWANFLFTEVCGIQLSLDWGCNARAVIGVADIHENVVLS